MFQNLFSTVVTASKTTTKHQITLNYNVKTHPLMCQVKFGYVRLICYVMLVYIM